MLAHYSRHGGFGPACGGLLSSTASRRGRPTGSRYRRDSNTYLLAVLEQKRQNSARSLDEHTNIVITVAAFFVARTHRSNHHG
ncbi:hypothetical protein HMPREF0291_12048 [Corynebacterium genitalium ATCC 33030]|uniref:Uncharacterized protein n=1 Tax=Corynebacterium genitalium ATCC 33030 TaxID=585529 RepID=D7WE36_9CORY|nr:hypothetical protein HMPREF0291_12048 [Corynebacterium genitalium ATCC 33030]